MTIKHWKAPSSCAVSGLPCTGGGKARVAQRRHNDKWGWSNRVWLIVSCKRQFVSLGDRYAGKENPYGVSV
jgi:hypothetical protein